MLKLRMCEIVVAVLLVAGLAGSAADSGDELVFCVTGDSRGDFKNTKINKPILEKLVVALRKEKPAFVLFNGDLVSGYSPKLEKQLTEWRDVFMKPLIDFGVRVYPCSGNHDASEGKFVAKSAKKAFKVWDKVFSGKYALPANGPVGEKGSTYFVKEKNVLVLVFDNYAKNRRHRVNLDWMREVLSRNMKRNGFRSHLFAVCHEPAFSVQHKDCLALHPENRDAFVKLFLKNGGVCFFCGHDHFYNHAKMFFSEGVFHQFVCGTAGAPLRNWNEKYLDKRVVKVKHSKIYGYMVVKVKGSKTVLTMKGWSEDGKLVDVDTFSYNLEEPAK